MGRRSGAVKAGLGANSYTGDQTLGDGKNIVLGTGTGTQIGTAAGQKLAIHGATPVARAAAIVQTDATAVRTVNAPTAVDPGSLTFLGADFLTLVAVVRALIVDVANVRQVLNAVIDDTQAFGINQ